MITVVIPCSVAGSETSIQRLVRLSKPFPGARRAVSAPCGLTCKIVVSVFAARGDTADRPRGRGSAFLVADWIRPFSNQRPLRRGVAGPTSRYTSASIGWLLLKATSLACKIAKDVLVQRLLHRSAVLLTRRRTPSDSTVRRKTPERRVRYFFATFLAHWGVALDSTL